MNCSVQACNAQAAQSWDGRAGGNVDVSAVIRTDHAPSGGATPEPSNLDMTGSGYTGALRVIARPQPCKGLPCRGFPGGRQKRVSPRRPADPEACFNPCGFVSGNEGKEPEVAPGLPSFSEGLG